MVAIACVYDSAGVNLRHNGRSCRGIRSCLRIFEWGRSCRTVNEMAEEVKEITLAGIAHRNPDFNAEQVHVEWLRILHGEALASLNS